MTFFQYSTFPTSIQIHIWIGNPRKLRPILCNAHIHSEQSLRPRPLGCLLPIQCQLVANPMLPSQFQCIVKSKLLECKSIAKPLSINCDLMPIQCNSCANLLSIWGESKANRLPNLVTWASIECQSCLNPLPILCQSCDNPVSILSQSSVNTISIITSNWDANPHHMLVKLI